jgi:hypothetical protein
MVVLVFYGKCIPRIHERFIEKHGTETEHKILDEKDKERERRKKDEKDRINNLDRHSLIRDILDRIR